MGHVGGQMNKLLGRELMHGLPDHYFKPAFKALQTDAARNAMRWQGLAVAEHDTNDFQIFRLEEHTGVSG